MLEELFNREISLYVTVFFLKMIWCITNARWLIAEFSVLGKLIFLKSGSILTPEILSTYILIFFKRGRKEKREKERE